MQSKAFSMSATLAKALLIFSCCILLYVTFTPFLNLLLLNYGEKTNAVITPNETSWRHRYTTNNYRYKFVIEGKTYTGNSLIEVGHTSKIGDSIDILYFGFCPDFNRPMSYYDK